MKRTIAAVLAAAALASAANGIADGDRTQAMQFFESGHYVHALDRLRAAARNGDVGAAEILGFMYGFGGDTFPGVVRDLSAATYWFDLAARGGRPVGRYMVCALRKQAGATALAPRQCFDWVAETGQPGSR